METKKDFVTLKELSETIGMDKSHLRRLVLKLGYKPQKRRTRDSGNQLTLTLTNDEANSVIEYRSKLGFGKNNMSVETQNGYFYVIQLVPDLDNKRIKLGFAIDVKDRLKQHQTSAPTAKLIKYWPCKRAWEITVMDCLSSIHCKHILNEVFECYDLDSLINKGDEIFGILPNPDNKIVSIDY